MAHAHSHDHDHAHSHDRVPHDEADPYVVDWEDSAPRLAVAAGADAPWYASVAATLVTPADRITADIGCGGAGMAAALAAVAPGRAYYGHGACPFP